MISLVKVSKSVQRHPFHLVDPSPWPFIASLAVLCCVVGLVMYMHAYKGANLILANGFFLLFSTMFLWWRDLVREATYEGHHTGIVQRGLRFGTILFIVSEILFFFAFFWAFFHSSLSPAIEIGSIWPPKGLNVLNPWQIPLLNTLILLLSGCTVTWCHHSIISNFRVQSVISLVFTIILAIIFTGFQIFEYNMAEFRLSDGIYGSTFYMATGFHGFHVFIGTLFLFVCLIRLLKYQLTQQHHFGFEAAAWYWHFVDVVWLFLFVSIYWWGGY
uniref:Cytochrome c oxidase subunit 3 n=1 Tax=Sheathia arcuata TaxID=340433 RepID=A0A1Z1XA68_9FLOR|nr:cytochrome c oxidase subunit 3 [Sheathia arcuata]ARX95746.1 cytochrome c oxidase subunit 3 [Sheathia arcuata]